MKAVVIYESMFGNTEEIARSIAAGLSSVCEVATYDVATAPAGVGEQVDLIVAGGPTHAFSMTRPATRAEAAKQGATHGSASRGLREWLEALDRGRHRQLVATFDTRVNKVRHLPGSAAKGAVKALRRHGYSPAVKQESFYVLDTSGPLVEGEPERAQAWGVQLGEVAMANLADGDEPGQLSSGARKKSEA